MDRDDLMLDEDRWPAWPRLPLKRYHREGNPVSALEVGCLFSGQGSKLYLVNLYKPITEETPTKEYESFRAVVADGWVVD